MPAETSSTTDVTMPQLGVSVVEGTVIRWLKQPGDHVDADEPLCEVDTDKIVTDIPSPATGPLQEILVNEGTTVEVGTVLARIASGSAGLRAGPVAGEDDSAGGAAEIVSPAPPPRSASAYLSPVVSRLAAEHGVDLASVMGTGRGGRVRKQDVLAGPRKRTVTSRCTPRVRIARRSRRASSRACADRSGRT